MQVRYISMMLAETALAAAVPQGAGVPPPWHAWTWRQNVDGNQAEVLRRRNEEACVRIEAAMPDLERGRADFDIVNDWIHEENLNDEQALARLRRLITLSDRGPYAPLGIEIADGTASVSTSLRDVDSVQETAQKARQFAAAAAAVASATGFLPFDPSTGRFALPEEAGAVAARLLAEPVRDVRRRALRTSLVFILINLMIAAVIAGLAWGAAQRSRLVRDVNPSQPLTFIVHGQSPVTYPLYVFPELRLAGVIRETRTPATMQVYRNTWISAQRGSPIVVFATGWAARPYISIDDYASNRPLVRLGPLAVNAPMLLAAGAMALWGGWLVFGYWRSKPLRRAVIRSGFARTGLFMVCFAAVVMAITLVNRAR